MADVIWLGGLVCAVCVVQLVHARLVRNEIVRMIRTCQTDQFQANIQIMALHKLIDVNHLYVLANMRRKRGPNKRTTGKLPTSLSRGNMCQTDSLIKKD